jgi:hypothetical protein
MILEPFGDFPLFWFWQALDGLFNFKGGGHEWRLRVFGRFVLLAFGLLGGVRAPLPIAISDADVARQASNGCRVTSIWRSTSRRVPC